MPTQDDVAEAAGLLDRLTGLVARASAAVTALAGHAAVRSKPDGSPVTVADEAAEAVILNGLARLMPGVPVVSEEQTARLGPPLLDPIFVLVDPLDGTREFIAGRDEYTVNLAIVSRAVPILGIVAAPARGLLWRGAAGKAERLRLIGDAAHDPSPVHTRRCPATGPVALVSRSHFDAGTDALLARLQPAKREASGSSIKFCRIAEGSADVYPRLGTVSEWDIAAGHALVVAAGGRVTAPHGEPLSYGRAADGFRVRGFIAWGDPAMRC